MKTKYASDVKLGDTYRDDQTGIIGVATAVCFFQHGCERVTIERVVANKIETDVFDAPRLVHQSSGKKVTTSRTGGDRPMPTRAEVAR